MISKIGVVGAGAMGSGIAQVAATAGCDVVLTDINEEVLQIAKNKLSIQLGKLLEKGKLDALQLNAIFGRIHFAPAYSALADCELVIEAVVEDIHIKHKIFNELEAIMPTDAIIASNTSSLSITEMAGKLKNPRRFAGIHFFNPAPLMKLVEVVSAIQTDANVIDNIVDTLFSWEKIVVKAKDSPGFIVNKVARPYYGEAIRILEEGIASMVEIDHAMTRQGFKMGPFALMDFIGLDVNLAVTTSVWQSFFYDARYKPSFTQKKLVEAGYLGKKTGRGFYDHSMSLPAFEPEEDSTLYDYVFKRIISMLINEATDTVQVGICSEEDVELAMLYGTNYPKGLLAWADELGYEEIIYTLDNLYDRYHEDRYRVSPYLRDRVSLL
ncbi:MAG: 3-hydroxybutyryl-CoA dehydrogenase [Saprospiraceae bacterium]|nr:3-hydroxybutyryl-CoA dehydrogenase [Saprospiraceae bacterium]